MSAAAAPVKSWSVGEILDVSRQFLEKHGCPQARLDAEVLLAHVLGVERIQFYAHPERPLTQDEQDAYRELIKRRQKAEPIAYITGEREFYGRNFGVDRRVLIPRPETEHLIDEALKQISAHHVRRVLDIGTGSGCIGITLACESQDIEVVASDLCEGALEVARLNAKRHGVSDRIRFVQSDAFTQIQDTFDLIVSNPPYIAPDEAPELAPDLQYEPSQALFAPQEGLAVIRTLLEEAPRHLQPSGSLIFECGHRQKEQIQTLASGWRFGWLQDLAGVERIFCGQRDS